MRSKIAEAQVQHLILVQANVKIRILHSYRHHPATAMTDDQTDLQDFQNVLASASLQPALWILQGTLAQTGAHFLMHLIRNTLNLSSYVTAPL